MVRLHRYLLVASLLVPALVFVAAAAWNRSEVLREGEATIERTTAILHEHARKVFDTVELALGRVDDRVRAQTWDEIAAPPTSAFLRDIKGPLDQVVSIWVSDADGRVRAGSQPWDPAVSVRERDFFAAQAERDAGLFISAAFQGRATRAPSFAVSRRRSTPDGRFDGTIHVALSPDYFARFFAEVAADRPHYAALIRRDGEILARSPQRAANARVDPDSPLMRAIAARPEAGAVTGLSRVDRQERVFAYRRVAPYPVHVSFAMDRAVILGRWYRNVLIYGVVALVSGLTLFGVSWLALRRAMAERTAVLAMRRESEQRLAAEQRLLQSQKMESLGQLTGGIAHDFNNLLAVVIGNLDLLRKRVAGDERARRLLENAIMGAQRGASLTQRLLAFSRRQDLTPQAVDVPTLVGGMMDLLQRSLGPGVRLATDFAPGLPPVNVDANQLELAFLNLAVNARDAMPEGGTITIAATPEQVQDDGGALRPGRYVRIAVRDTGQGMDEVTLARAIEPFFTTKGVGKGTGLGLSMIHGFAVQSGGTMRLASAPGEGTTAELWLPQGEALAGAGPAAAAPAGHAHRAATILLVEDDPLVMAGTAAMLEEMGHEVLEATSGEAALAVLGTHAGVDLVVTDHAMPGMTGLELAERTRAGWPDLPILLASGHAELPERAGLSLPRITKPFDGAELSAAIADVLGVAALRRTRGAGSA